MTEFLQHMINMLILGSTYALLGIGLTLIFGIMRIVNFAHGELYAFGAYFVYFAAILLGFNFFVSLLVAIVAGCILGAVIEWVLLRPMRGADIDTTMLIMIGAMIVMQNGEQYHLGRHRQVGQRRRFRNCRWCSGRSRCRRCGCSCSSRHSALIGATYYLINRTKLGKAMRATFQDRDTASLMGVNVQAIYMATFAIGSSLAAAAGALLGPVYVVSPQMGNIASLKAFAIVILGGLGSIGGATIGGFILAFAEEIGAGYVSSGYRDAMGFLLIIAVLLFKPTGLFARSERIG